MTIEQTPIDEAVSAYFSYIKVLKDLVDRWLQNELAFGSIECRKIADDLARRAIELNAEARDWQIRAQRTAAMERSNVI
jgi:hypothetical protein